MLHLLKKKIYIPLHSFSRPFEALPADIVYISFLARSAVNPKLCLFIDFVYFKNLYIPHENKKSCSKNNGIIL